jgi:hypothetical protein
MMETREVMVPFETLEKALFVVQCRILSASFFLGI